MARKIKLVTIEGDPAVNRDAGKCFEITEMAPDQQEAWAARALSAIGRTAVDIPEDILQRGMAGIFIVGVKALSGIRWEELKPLLDEMMGCVALIPNAAVASTGMKIKDPLMSQQIEEVSTRLLLRDATMELHLGFSIAAELAKFRASSAAKREG